MKSADKIVKKLSPSEPLLTLHVDLYISGYTPVSRIGKIIEKKYQCKVELDPPYHLSFKIKRTFMKADELLNILKNIVSEFNVYLSNICVDAYMYYRGDLSDIIRQLSCNIYRDDKRIIALCKDKHVYYIVINKVKKYTTIRVIMGRIYMTDPLSVPRSIFKTCGNSADIITYVENYITSIKDLIDGNDERPIQRP